MFQLIQINCTYDWGVVEGNYAYFFLRVDEAQLWDMEDKPKCFNKFKYDGDCHIILLI